MKLLVVFVRATVPVRLTCPVVEATKSLVLNEATPVTAVVASLAPSVVVVPDTVWRIAPEPVTCTAPVNPLNEVTPMLYRVSVLPDVTIPIPDPATVMTVSPVA